MNGLVTIATTIMDKSLGTILHFWGVFQFTQVQPLLTNNVGRVYAEFFFEFQLCTGWGEGELREIFETDAPF